MWVGEPAKIRENRLFERPLGLAVLGDLSGVGYRVRRMGKL